MMWNKTFIRKLNDTKSHNLMRISGKGHSENVYNLSEFNVSHQDQKSNEKLGLAIGIYKEKQSQNDCTSDCPICLPPNFHDSQEKLNEVHQGPTLILHKDAA